MVLYPAKATSEKLRPCWVRFWIKAVASEFDWGMGRSKIAVRAEISTGTEMFIHCLATAELASSANVEIGNASILGTVKI